MKLEDAISVPPMKHELRLKDGTLLLDYCKNNNLSYITISARLRKGLTPDEAIMEPIAPHRKIVVSPDGSSMLSYCTKYKIPYSQFKAYRRKLGKDISMEIALKSYFEKYPNLIQNLPKEEIIRLFGEEIEAIFEMLGMDKSILNTCISG